MTKRLLTLIFALALFVVGALPVVAVDRGYFSADVYNSSEIASRTSSYTLQHSRWNME